MVDLAVLAQWEKHFDDKFARDFPQFIAWFQTHPDYQQEISPRIAHKCQRYQDEYLEAKQYGVIEAEIVVPQLEDAT